MVVTAEHPPFTPTELARLAKLQSPTITKACRDGKIRHYRLPNGRIRIPYEEGLRWIGGTEEGGFDNAA